MLNMEHSLFWILSIIPGTNVDRMSSIDFDGFDGKMKMFFISNSLLTTNLWLNVSVYFTDKRKMVSGQDVMAAMEDMELGAFKAQLDEALEAFRRDKSAKKDKKKAKDGPSKRTSGDGVADAKLRGRQFKDALWCFT